MAMLGLWLWSVDIPGKHVGIVHTVVAYAGFFGALIVGLALHYEKVYYHRVKAYILTIVDRQE